MAIGRLSMKVGKAGKAGPHAAYIAREGQYASRLDRGEKLESTEAGNMPAWAQSNPLAFWQAADAFERANGTTYREMEIALPRELDEEQRSALIREFVRQEIGERHAYQWAIHTPIAEDGKEQPHAHLMFSERQRDGIDRDPDQYFKRFNAKAPEKGGARKGYGQNAGQTLTKVERVAELKELRGRWEAMCNAHLERAGVEQRIDMRSHAERGTGLEPERKQLPSQWRGEGKGNVIKFREDRAELVEARQELAAVVPDMGAEITNLAEERQRSERAQGIDLAAQRRRTNRNPPEIQSRWDARRDRRAAQEKQRLAIQQVADREAAQQKQADEAKARDRANAQAFQDHARIVENAAKKREERLGVVETWMLENPRAGFFKRKMAPSGVRKAVDELGGWDKATAAVDARQAERDAMASRERAAEAKRKEALSSIHRLGYQYQGIVADEGRDSPAANAAYTLAFKQAGEWKEKAGLSTEEIKGAWDGGKAALVKDRRAREQEKQRQEANAAREAPIRQLCREAGGLYQSRIDLAPQHEELYLSMARKQVDSILSGTGLNVRDVADDFEAGRRDEMAAKEQRQREAAATRSRPAREERKPEVSKEMGPAQEQDHDRDVFGR